MSSDSTVKITKNKSFISKYELLTPIIITIGFFLSTSYLAFFQNLVWTETDGIYYLNFGRAILDDNGKNVIIVNGQIGASVLFAFLESIFHDAFIVQKSIAILSGSGIVFFSFLITRNIFDFRIATVVTLFFAFQPRLHFLSTQALNELLPVLMIMSSLFVLTRKNSTIIHYVLIGTLLGLSSIFRLQAAFILVGISGGNYTTATGQEKPVCMVSIHGKRFNFITVYRLDRTRYGLSTILLHLFQFLP